MLPVVVIRSNDICFQGILRSLAAANIPAICVTYSWEGARPWHSEKSRYFTQNVNIRNPHTHPRETLSDLVQLGNSLLERYGRKLLVLTSSDTGRMFFVDHYHILGAYFQMVGNVDYSSARRDVMDKGTLSESLEQAGIRVPTFQVVRKLDDVQRAVREMPYPCVFKPVVKDYGQTFYKMNNRLKAVRCETADDLERGLRASLEKGFQLLVQKYVPVRSAKDEVPIYIYADENYKVRMIASGHKEVIEPEPFGTAIILKKTSGRHLLDHAQKIASALKWRGLLMIEFIWDDEAQDWTVIEINCRAWLFQDFYRRCGMNYIGITALDWSGVPIDPHVPSIAVQDAECAFHISLSDCFERFHMKTGGEAPVKRFLDCMNEKFEGKLSFTYMDPSDEAPIRSELAFIKDNFRLSMGEIGSIQEWMESRIAL